MTAPIDFTRYVRGWTDFPKAGVTYWDFTPLLEDPAAFRAAVCQLSGACEAAGVDRIVAIEAKGFVLGASIAHEMSLPLTLIRKPGLTPGQVDCADFRKEYGDARYCLSSAALRKGERIAAVYDIFAGPGASGAAQRLVEMQGATVAVWCFVIELEYLGGREQLSPAAIHSLVRLKSTSMSFNGRPA